MVSRGAISDITREKTTTSISKPVCVNSLVTVTNVLPVARDLESAVVGPEEPDFDRSRTARF